MYLAIRGVAHSTEKGDVRETTCPHCGWEWLEWSDALQWPEYCPGCGKSLHKDESDEQGMTKRQVWLKLFSENDQALASAIHLCQRFVTEAALINNEEFLKQKRMELDTIIPEEIVREIFEEKLEEN